MPLNETPASVVQSGLAKWHSFVETGDMAILSALLADDVVFRSPFAFAPTSGRRGAELVLGAVIQVFENFRYHRTFICGEQDVALEFSARVDKFDLKGIDLMSFNASGKIADLEVMIRPAKALLALGEAMGKRIGPELSHIKAGGSAK